MYEFKHESEKKERKFKLYLILFILSRLVHVCLDFFDFGIGKTFGMRIVGNLLFSVTILYFGLHKKAWAEWLIKFLVWVDIILLILAVLVMVLK